jgi:hypothetical protein
MTAAAAVWNTAQALRRTRMARTPSAEQAQFDAAHPFSEFVQQAITELQAVTEAIRACQAQEKQ